MYALLARVPPVTTYRPSGDIITMCGLTLLPRNVFPTIFFVLMSMNAISFESRLTIITTVVGSATLTVAARRRTPANAAPNTRATVPAKRIRLAAIIAAPPGLIPNLLESRLKSNGRNQEADRRRSRRRFEDVLQVQRKPQFF